MKTTLTVADWTERGYRRCEVGPNREINKLADFLLQKRIDDDIGKRYYITVYCYDRSRYPDYMQDHMSAVGFMPTAHMSIDSGPHFEFTVNACDSIDPVETYFDQFWRVVGQPYYELFDVAE